MEINLKQRYKKSDKRSIEAIELLTKNLELDESYLTSLDLLVLNYDMLYDAIDDIKKNGYTILYGDGSKQVKNHACQTFNNAQQAILKILASFPSSPLTKAHLRKLNNVDDEEKSPLEEFLNR